MQSIDTEQLKSLQHGVSCASADCDSSTKAANKLEEAGFYRCVRLRRRSQGMAGKGMAGIWRETAGERMALQQAISNGDREDEDQEVGPEVPKPPGTTPRPTEPGHPPDKPLRDPTPKPPKPDGPGPVKPGAETHWQPCSSVF